MCSCMLLHVLCCHDIMPQLGHAVLTLFLVVTQWMQGVAKHSSKPEGCYSQGSAASGWHIYVGMASPAGRHNWRHCSELATFVDLLGQPPEVLFPKKPGPNSASGCIPPALPIPNTPPPPNPIPAALSSPSNHHLSNQNSPKLPSSSGPVVPALSPPASPFADANKAGTAVSAPAPATPDVTDRAASSSAGAVQLAGVASLDSEPSAPGWPTHLALPSSDSAPGSASSQGSLHSHSVPSCNSQLNSLNGRQHSQTGMQTTSSSGVHYSVQGAKQATSDQPTADAACRSGSWPATVLSHVQSLAAVATSIAAPSPAVAASTAAPPPAVVTEAMRLSHPAHLLCLQHDWQELASKCAQLTVDAQHVPQLDQVLSCLHTPLCLGSAPGFRMCLLQFQKGQSASGQSASGISNRCRPRCLILQSFRTSHFSANCSVLQPYVTTLDCTQCLDCMLLGS